MRSRWAGVGGLCCIIAAVVVYRAVSVRPLESILYDIRESRHETLPPYQMIPTRDKGGDFSNARILPQAIYLQGHSSGWAAASREFVERKGKTDRIAAVCDTLCDRDESQHGGREWWARFRLFAVGFEDGYAAGEARLHAAAAAHGLQATLSYCERMRPRPGSDLGSGREPEHE